MARRNFYTRLDLLSILSTAERRLRRVSGPCDARVAAERNFLPFVCKCFTELPKNASGESSLNGEWRARPANESVQPRYASRAATGSVDGLENSHGSLSNRSRESSAPPLVGKSSINSASEAFFFLFVAVPVILVEKHAEFLSGLRPKILSAWPNRKEAAVIQQCHTFSRRPALLGFVE